jgi:hypothetical protein
MSKAMFAPPLVLTMTVANVSRSTGMSVAIRAVGDTARAISTAISAARRDGYSTGDLIVFANARVHLATRDASAIAEALRARFTETTPISCPNGVPGSCTLNSGTVAVEVTGYRELDATHVVELRFGERTESTRQPIHYTEFSVTLAQKDGAWVVAKVERVSDS